MTLAAKHLPALFRKASFAEEGFVVFDVFPETLPALKFMSHPKIPLASFQSCSPSCSLLIGSFF
jgi:hypothetical protein